MILDRFDFPVVLDEDAGFHRLPQPPEIFACSIFLDLAVLSDLSENAEGIRRITPGDHGK